MDAKEKAKELVNKLYQPLGYLHCKTTSRNMWEYAKYRAIEFVDEILEYTKEPVLPMAGISGYQYDTYLLDVKREIERL